MSESSTFPALGSWMASAPGNHPLRELFDSAEESDHPTSYRRTILQAFDDIIRILEEAQPQRLSGPKGDFLKAKTDDDLLIVRAELVAGAKLAVAGVGFDFGPRKGTPEPDLILREANLGVEVKARRLNGLKDLEQKLAAALAQVGAEVTVYLACRERPLVVKADVIENIVTNTLDRVRDSAWGTELFQLEQPWAATKQLALAVRVFDQAIPLMPGPHVVVEDGFELSGHLQDVESEVLAVLADPQKIKQAEARPTILLIDAARTGLSWMRSPGSWARRLADLLPDSTPFVGIGVMIPTLDKADAPISLALRGNAAAEDLDAAKKLAADLGLELTD
ncbi:hypothetical protein AB0F71_18655 [Kitasatospora sp. NPDC028055]|uniref:hypothetical protein n=1 Tax=Kitasatospora sp. NPDC028055 TaxID=3155653 RepID=UPI0033CA5E0E